MFWLLILYNIFSSLSRLTSFVSYIFNYSPLMHYNCNFDIDPEAGKIEKAIQNPFGRPRQIHRSSVIIAIVHRRNGQ